MACHHRRLRASLFRAIVPPPRPFSLNSARPPMISTPRPRPPRAAALPPGASALHRAIQESRLGAATLYKLAIGAAVLVFLLMSLLPTPHDPQSQNLQARLAFPLAAVGGHVLGGDQLGRDVLSRLMVGGRALLFRLPIVGLLLTAPRLISPPLLHKKTRPPLPAPPLP